MPDFRLCMAVGLVSLGMATMPVRAQEVGQPASPYETRLRRLDGVEAAALIDKLKQAQEGLRRGDRLYFELLSGAPASYPMTTTSPREALLSADFSHPFDVERLSPADSGRKTYRLTLVPNGVGNLLWDVRVTVGFNGRLDRVEMLYRPPNP